MAVISYWLIFGICAFNAFLASDEIYAFLLEWIVIAVNCSLLYISIELWRRIYWKSKKENGLFIYFHDLFSEELNTLGWEEELTEILADAMLFINFVALLLWSVLIFVNFVVWMIASESAVSWYLIILKHLSYGRVSLLIFLIDLLLVWWFLIRKRASIPHDNDTEQPEELIELGDRVEPVFWLFRQILKQWELILSWLLALSIISGAAGLFCWYFPQFIPFVEKQYAWLSIKAEFFLQFWWGKTLFSCAIILVLLVIGRAIENRGKRDEQGHNYPVVKARSMTLPPLETERKKDITINVKRNNDRQPMVSSVDPDINEVLKDIGNVGFLEGWIKTKGVERTRRQAVQIIDAEIKAAKKRVEYVRTVAEESSVVDEERLRIAKLRQEMERLELQDVLERKRLEKEIEELERDIRVMRVQPEKPEKPPKPLSEEERQKQELERARKRNKHQVEMQKLQAEQGLAARQALLEAMNKKIDEIKYSDKYREDVKEYLIEDVEDYYRDLLDRTD